MDAWADLIQATGIQELALTGIDMIRAGRMQWDHRDPFDRMIVAQALRHGATLVTADQAIIETAPVSVLRA